LRDGGASRTTGSPTCDLEEPAAADAGQPKPDLARYTGIYESGFAGETAIVEWEDGLAALSLPTMDPVKGLTKLKKVGENTFRRVRNDEA